ncbi:MAG: glycosyltransferase family 4 protein [Candidatus Dormibacteria bacterium]
MKPLLIAAPGASELLTDHLPHGEGMIAYQLLSRLARRGHRVIAMTPRAEVNTLPEGMEVRIVPRRAPLTLLEPFAYDRRAGRELARIRPRPDIVHWILPFNPLEDFTPRLPAGARLVLGPVPPAWPAPPRSGPRAAAARALRSMLGPERRRRNRATFRHASRVLVVVPQVLDLLPEAVRPRAGWVPNGVDTGLFVPARPEPRPFTVLFCANLNPRKGLDHLLEAMSILAGRVPEARLLVVGGPEAATGTYRRRAAALDLEGRVEFTGPVDHDRLTPFFHRADAFCLPSLGEPFGMTLIEAMACGLPLVATRAGGVPEVVREGQEALLVPPGDPPALAEALTRLALDPGLCRAMGAGNRAAAVARYDWERVVDQVEAAYREALQAPAPQ